MWHQGPRGLVSAKGLALAKDGLADNQD